MRHGRVKKFAWVIVPGNVELGRSNPIIPVQRPPSNYYTMMAGQKQCSISAKQCHGKVMDTEEGVWKCRVVMGGIYPIVM